MITNIRINKFFYDAMEQNSEKTNLFTSFPQSCKEAVGTDRAGDRGMTEHGLQRTARSGILWKL